MIKFVQYGCGKMSKYTISYAMERGYELVGAVDINPDVIGKDVSCILGGDDIGITITSASDARSMMESVKPDVCIVTTMSLMSDVADSLKLCAELGINAITTCEEAFYPFNSSPKLTSEIDSIAKKNNCTITGSGYQDAFWGNLISTIAGATNKITKIKGRTSYNVEDYGIALAEAHGAGLSLEEFDKKIASVDEISDEERNKMINEGTYQPSYMWNTNGWLCDKLNLTVDEQTQECIPEVARDDIYSSTLNMTINKGDATGMSARVTTTTKEGIVIETECVGKVYDESEFDSNEWTVFGEPDTTMIINKPATVELTCATIVNRIPDLIKCEAGFVPTSKMGELHRY